MDDGFYELRLYGVLRSLCRPTHKPCALQWRLDVRGSVAPPRGKVGFDPPRGLPPRHPRLGALEDRFDVVPVGVDDEGGIVVGVVALAQTWGPVITPPLARAAAWKFRTASGSEATKARWSGGLVGSPSTSARSSASSGPRTTAGPHDCGGPGTSVTSAPSGFKAAR